MTDLRIIPDEPYAGPRERYRELAAQERMPSPWEFDPRPARRLVWVPGIVGLFLLAGLVAGLFTLVIWSSANVG